MRCIALVNADHGHFHRCTLGLKTNGEVTPECSMAQEIEIRDSSQTEGWWSSRCSTCHALRRLSHHQLSASFSEGDELFSEGSCGTADSQWPSPTVCPVQTRSSPLVQGTSKKLICSVSLCRAEGTRTCWFAPPLLEAVLICLSDRELTFFTKIIFVWSFTVATGGWLFKGSPGSS
jgi:hypothetical protein